MSILCTKKQIIHKHPINSIIYVACEFDLKKKGGRSNYKVYFRSKKVLNGSSVRNDMLRKYLRFKPFDSGN